jgi:hypothetical protein
MSPLIGALLYLLISIACATAGVRAALGLETRRGEILERGQRAVLALVGVVAGALWLPLTVVLVRGWTREILPRRVMSARAKVRRMRMHALPVSPPAPAPVYTVPTLVPSTPKPVAEPVRSRVTANSLWPSARIDAA